MRTTKHSRLRGFLGSPRAGIFAVFIAVVLNLPSIPSGWQVDDLVHRANFLEVGPMMDSSNMTNRMFDFLSGDPEEILAFKDIGVLPWWAFDSLKISFWRPLSSFTHVVDYALWPQSGALMHLHSLAWLAFLIASTSLVYRRVMPTPILAGLAALLYALDDAHGLPAGFLANRNALVGNELRSAQFAPARPLASGQMGARCYPEPGRVRSRTAGRRERHRSCTLSSGICAFSGEAARRLQVVDDPASRHSSVCASRASTASRASFRYASTRGLLRNPLDEAFARTFVPSSMTRSSVINPSALRSPKVCTNNSCRASEWVTRKSDSVCALMLCIPVSH